MVRKYASCLIIAAVLLAGCESTSEDVTAEPIEVVSDPHSVCEEGTETASNRRFRVGTELRGDVDGDGSEDLVWLASDPSGPERCRDFLAVETKSKLYWAAVDVSAVPSSLPAPRLNSLVDIDAEPGAEIVANLEAGASTEFVGVFVLTRAGLERMTIDGRGPGPFGAGTEDLFAYGGSVGHMNAVDCAEDGLVVMSSAVPEDQRPLSYGVERRFFETSHAALVLDKDLTERDVVRAQQIDDFSEFTSSPFGSCD